MTDTENIMAYAPVTFLQQRRCQIREFGDRWLAARGDEHGARDDTMVSLVDFCIAK